MVKIDRKITVAIKLAVSALLLVMLFRAAQWSAVIEALQGLDRAWLAWALLLFVPQTLLSAWRWRELIAGETHLTLGDSLRQTLASNAFNLIMPAKTGDFTKAAWAGVTSPAGRVRLGRCVLIEKLADVACLLLCIVAGQVAQPLAIIGPTVVVVLLIVGMWERSRSQPTHYLRPLVATVGLWILHLAQIQCFLLAAGVPSSLNSTLVRVPLALFSGLMPGTFCGFGSRDSALVWLYADVAPAATMAVVGLLTALRYLVPGAAGIVVLLVSPVGLASGEGKSSEIGATMKLAKS